MDWAQILVIMLSSLLGCLLLLGIILIVLFVKLTVQIRTMTKSARSLTERAENIVSGSGKIASLVSLLQLTENISVKRGMVKATMLSRRISRMITRARVKNKRQKEESN